MPSIEELLDQAENETSAIEPVNDILEIDPETRTVLIPDSEIIFGVEADQRAERKYFRCPKIVGNNIDLSELEIYVIFQNAGGSDEENRDAYHVQDLEDTGDGYVTFSWELTEKVTRYVGQVSFVVAATRTLSDGTLQNRWSTTIATGKSLIGLQTGMSEDEQQQASDLYTQLITELNANTETKKSEITTLTNEKKSLLENTGTNQKNLVESEGTKQIQSVENKGTATLATIPEDYTALNGSVSNLNDLMHTKAPAIVEEATSGTEITVKDSAEGMRLQGMSVYGKSWQKTTTGKNLFDANSVVKGYYINDESGIAISNIGSYCSDYIPVVVGKSYRIETLEDAGGQLGAFYDINKTYISGILGYMNKNIIAPDNAAYMRLTVSNNNSNPNFANNFLLVQTDSPISPTDFEPYTGGKPSPSPEYPQEIQSVGYVLSTGKNLFDFSKLDANYGLNVKDKTVIIPAKTNNVGYYNSFKELCPSIQAGKTYVLNAKTSNPEALRIVHLVNANIDFSFEKAFTPTEEQINDKIAFYNHPDTEKENVISEIQLEEGSVATSYEPYTGGVPALYQKDVKVRVTGKNLFDADEYYSAYKQTDGMYKVDDVKLNNIIIIFDSSMVGKTYTASCNLNCPNGVSSVALEVNIDNKKVVGSIVSSNKSGISKVTFTPKTVKDNIKITYGSGRDDIIFSDFQIEKGSEATTYEPYKQPQSLPITTPTGLPAIPVPSGTSGITYTDADGQAWIADEIDFERGKYIQRVWQAEFDGSEDENWTFEYKTKTFYADNVLPVSMSYHSGFSNKYIANKGNMSILGIQFGRNNRHLCVVNDSTFDELLSDYGLSNWKAHLAEHPLKVMTYLDTPIETDLSEEQIQAYKAVHTNKPTTIISNDADAWMGASYAADTKIWIENKLKEIVTS